MKRMFLLLLVLTIVFGVFGVAALAEETAYPVIPETTCEPGAVPPTIKPTANPTAIPTTAPTVSAPSATATTAPKKNTLANAKKAAKKELRNYLNLNNYDESGKKLIKDLIRAANKDINGLKSKKQVKEYLKVAKKILKDIPTKEELGISSGTTEKIYFIKKIVRVKRKKTITVKVIVNSGVSVLQSAKKIKWSINKTGNRIIKFAKKAGNFDGKKTAKIKALKKGKAKVICKMPGGKKAVCSVFVL